MRLKCGGLTQVKSKENRQNALDSKKATSSLGWKKQLRLTYQQFNIHVKLNFEVGEKLPLTLLRNGKRIQFDWPLTDGD